MNDERPHVFPGLDEATFSPDPIAQFRAWHERARVTNARDPDAMALATANEDWRPSVRMVLLRGYDAGGFLFFTNYESRKGGELRTNPQAALLWYWPELDRQIRVEGTVERASSEESASYFSTRPRESQLAAWASPQSRVVEDRDGLERRMAELADRYRGAPVPRPDHWGGFRVRHDRIEFWLGRPHRLHDRLCYSRSSDGTWQLARLAP